MELVLSAVHWFVNHVDAIALEVWNFARAWCFGHPPGLRAFVFGLTAVGMWLNFFRSVRRDHREERDMHRYGLPGDFCARVDIHWFALGALADRPSGRRRVVVVTEKPLNAFIRWVSQVCARVFLGELRYFHGELDATFVARHASRFDVVIVGPFAKDEPAWVAWLSNGGGATHRAEMEHFYPARVPYAGPANIPTLPARDGSKG